MIPFNPTEVGMTTTAETLTPAANTGYAVLIQQTTLRKKITNALTALNDFSYGSLINAI